MLDAPTIRGIQGEIALGRLSAGEIALRYGLPERTVREVRVGLRRPVRSADPQLIPRVLEAYADALTEPLGVLDEAPEPPEPGEEDLQLEHAAERYLEAQATKRRATVRARSTSPRA